jgi:hypothetical protein
VAAAKWAAVSGAVSSGGSGQWGGTGRHRTPRSAPGSPVCVLVDLVQNLCPKKRVLRLLEIEGISTIVLTTVFKESVLAPLMKRAHV